MAINSMERAINNKDYKYIKMCEVYSLYIHKRITNKEAEAALGKAYKNTIAMWE